MAALKYGSTAPLTGSGTGTQGGLPSAALGLFQTRVSDQPFSTTPLTPAHMSPFSPPSVVHGRGARAEEGAGGEHESERTEAERCAHG